MSDPENHCNFEELRVIAKQIDKGVENLEKKLINVHNLGLSLAPENLRSKALDVLKEYEFEIQTMRENCEHCLEEEKKRLNDCIENNGKVTNFIEELRSDLDKLENILKNCRNYQPSQDLFSQEKLNNSLNVSEKGESVNSELESNLFVDVSNQYSVDSFNQIAEENEIVPVENNSLDIGSLTISGSNCGDVTFNISNDSVVNTLETSKISSKRFDKSYESLDKSTSISVTHPIVPVGKKTYYTKDVCRTPVDPGISLTSLKLLGRSDIKTKVYKTDLFEPSLSKIK